MSMVKVIYVDQGAGRIKDSRLQNLIAMGKIAAYCGPQGWVSVTGEKAPNMDEREQFKKRVSERENAGS